MLAVTYMKSTNDCVYIAVQVPQLIHARKPSLMRKSFLNCSTRVVIVIESIASFSLQ